MYICICNGVTDRAIRSAVEEGAHSLDCLRDQLGVASCCGSCACAAEELLSAERGGGAGAPAPMVAEAVRGEATRAEPARVEATRAEPARAEPSRADSAAERLAACLGAPAAEFAG